MGGHNVKYTTDCRKNETSVLLNRYESVVISKNLLIPHPRLLIPSLEYREAMSLYELEILVVSVMDLLVRYVYPVLSGYAKANIIFYLKKGEDDEIAKPLNKQSIPLTFENGTPIPKSDIYTHVSRRKSKQIGITLLKQVNSLYRAFYCVFSYYYSDS